MNGSTERICIVSAQYLPHIGGVENYVASLSGELIKRGYAVTIVTSHAKGLPDYKEYGALEIFRMPTLQLMKGRFPVTYPSPRRHRLIKRLRKRNFRAMLVNVRFYFLSLLAVRIAKKMRCPCYLLDHGSGHLTMSGRLATRLGERFEHWITKREKRYNPRFAAVSKASAVWLRHFGIETDLILPNAIDPAEFLKMAERPERDFREEYGIPKSDLIISFVGRLTKEKGVSELCRAFRMVAEERDDVHLFLAGDGYLRGEIEGTHPRIVCLGNCSRQAVIDLNRQSDLFCLPSVSEGFSTAILEAAMCNCYLIATAVGGAVDLIRSPEAGTILQNADPETVATAIRSAARDPEKRTRGAAICRRVVEEEFTWERTADRFLNELELKK